MKKTNNKYITDNKKRIYTTIALITLLMLIVISSALVKGLSVTEIMFNPQGSDTGREWIEITLNESDGCINLSQYKLFEADTNHKIYPYNSDIACNSAIICSDTNAFLTDYSYLNNTILSIYKSTFSLSNTGEEISLKLNNTTIDSVNYTSILLHTEVPEGYSLEKRGNTWNSSIYTGGDPGDFIEKAISDLNSNNSDANSTNDTIPNNITEANITANITDNSTINVTSNMTGNESIDIINATNSTSAEFNTTNSTTNVSTNVSVNISINTSANTSSNISMNTSTNTSLNISTNTSINTSINISINITTNITINTSINSSINISSNTTFNISSNTSTNISNISVGTKCQAVLNIIIKNESIIYDNGLPIKFYNKINFTVINYSSNISSSYSGSINYSIDYWIEDLTGTIVKTLVSTNNQDEKTFTPKIDETDKILLIKNIVHAAECNITKNASEKMLIIRNRNYTSTVCAKTVCPKCATETSNAAKCTGYIDYSTGLNSIIYKNNCTQKPLIKIIKECNETGTVSKRIQEQGINNNTPSVYISTTTNKTNNSKNQNTATGMIIYESPNLQNRFYALIGLVIVGLICTIIIAYRFFNRKVVESPIIEKSE